MDFEEKENMPQPQILSLDDDFSLIKSFIDGDESAFGELVKRHKEKVRNIIYLTLSNTNAIDDIAQEVFITVFKNLKSFRFESQFTTWLYRITINKCKDHLRKTKIRKIFLPLNDDEEYNVLSSINENTDIKQIVRNAIASLPDKLRIPIMLKDLEGFSYQEIADTMNCEIGTIKSRIFRGRETLKNILKPIEKELML
ncbi:MAG TPA: sigma-70 family RNA polymerase sigma factor [Ignavibacteriaceae bacterium]|jgi:RNA polymerase sigma-70 factor (ECF subfamily)|nr:MAG: ECF RNA polymerase sigma-E factor [Ignavibacteria bacterium ADurb.Bin266]OQY71499.1 MAG: RNA polymerase subunit sigma-70 [Ignavibacteriales bacterium UTCHB2]HQF42687.1 sigma-70 family RNA polymerase sigma factor [Ignavibacteriaceae bacterium]HQI40206.1 sigma-70 family RNA polymerase sigma factor [Ignavibacteriaceae bacterium]